MGKIKKWIKENKFIIFLFLFSFIIRLGVILLVDTPIISDFKMMYDAALEVVNGTDSYKSMGYFITWGYQMGHVLYQAFLLNIVNSVFFLKIVNCIITSLTVVFVYLISKRICSERSAKISSILYSIFLFPLLLNTVLTNQFLPVLLILIALYILLNINFKKKIVISSAVVGILLGLSNIFRSETIVIVFSILLYFVFLFITKVDWKKLIVSFLIIFMGYYVVFNGTSLLLKATNVSPSGLDILNSSWKFVLGFNYETSGMYSNEDAAIYAGDSEAAKKEAINRIMQFEKIPLHFLKKTKILWFNSDLSWSISMDEVYYKILNVINQLWIILFNILAVCSAFRFIKLKFEKEHVLMCLILLVYFGVYLLIVVMPRYAYSLQVFEAIIIGISLDYIFTKIKALKKGK